MIGGGLFELEQLKVVDCFFSPAQAHHEREGAAVVFVGVIDRTENRSYAMTYSFLAIPSIQPSCN